MGELDSLGKIKSYLQTYVNKDEIKQEDIEGIEFNFFLIGGTVYETLESIDSYEEYFEIEDLMDKLIGKIKSKNCLFLRGIIHKMYLILCELQHVEIKPLPKGQILHTEGLMYYYLGKIDLGIRFITLAFIEDIVHKDLDWAFTSYAFRFLATHVYDEPTARKIGLELNRRIDFLKSNGLTIFFPEAVLNVHDHVDVIPGEANILFTLNLIYYRELFNSYEEAIEGDDTYLKGVSLENLIRFLFSSVVGLNLMGKKVKTDSSEIDVVFRILDSNNPLYGMFGQYLIIECKNTQDPVDVVVIRDFVGKLQSLDVHGGIIVSREGITQDDNERLYAELEISKAYHRHGITLIIMDNNDLIAIKEGNNLITILLKNYEKTRFDKKYYSSKYS